MRIGPFGVWEILIILVVVLLIFGPRRLPEMAKGLGQSVRAFRKEMRDLKEDFDVDERPSRAERPASRAGEGTTAAGTVPADPTPAAGTAPRRQPERTSDEPPAHEPRRREPDETVG